MYKMKTKKSALKRFRIKPSGKITRDMANHEHIATKKSKNRKNRLKKGALVHSANQKLILACLPNNR
ncbi:MAG: 50S ribosomal protein L35 [Oligoflexales bacterium]|nr:50S ribosomal protein L35 [Oligoflexales bacterium]